MPERDTNAAQDRAIARAYNERGGMLYSTWTREQAFHLVAQIEPWFASIGYHVAMGGSVLTKGRSTKDLDLITYPHQVPLSLLQPKKLDVIRQMLEALGWWRWRSAEEMRAHWVRKYGTADLKDVDVWLDPRGRRVDVIMMEA